MNIQQKLEILAMSAKYDASCSSSGSSRHNTGGLGDAVGSGICHSWSEDGRCISLLKILMSNNCAYDCAYCANRRGNDILRAAFTPEEAASLVVDFYRRNYIEGLFLSSAVIRSPDYTMELIIRSVELIRIKHRFNGYIHVKCMPGADPALIAKAGLLADRMSVNIELPSQKSLERLAPQKTKTGILSAMGHIHRIKQAAKLEYKGSAKAPKFLPAGHSTQLIVGASPEKDMTIIKLAESLYNKFSMKRVYYSAFIPVMPDSRLPALPPPLRRENRLYQADWLLRFYGFTASEILDDEHPDLDADLDPKASWAVRNLHRFPVEVNTADYETLLRVPGIGVRSAQIIVRARRTASLKFEDLKRIGVVLKRAKFFLTCAEKFQGESDNALTIKNRLIALDAPADIQLSLFTGQPQLPAPASLLKAATGER